MDRYCKQCGALLKENAKFCNKCGAPVKNEEVPAEEELEQAAPAELPSEPVSYSAASASGSTGKNPAAAGASGNKKGFQLSPGLIAIMLCIVAAAVFAVVKFGLPTANGTAPEPTAETAVVEEPEVKNDEMDSPAEGSAQVSHEDQSAEKQPEETAAPSETPEVSEEPEPAVVIDEEYVANAWYTYYISYLEAINQGGDASYLKNVTDERKKSFVENYEKYNKGYTFENITFDVDKTDMSLKDSGDGMIEATCHAYAANVCTTIATGAVEDNRVTLLGKLQFDSKTGDWLLLQQQSDKNYVFGKHELIHCAD